MKKLLFSAIAVCLVSFAPTVSWAQQHPPGHPPGGAPSHARPMGHPAMTGPAHFHHVVVHHFVTHHPVIHHVSHHHPIHVTVHVAHHATIHATTHVVRHPAIRASVGIASYRRNIAAAHRFHAGEYRAPAGYAYRRWVFGERLPPQYFVRDYWISDYLNFDLMGPPDGYVWVRFGPDALLVDEDTGEIVQVDYGVFY